MMLLNSEIVVCSNCENNCIASFFQRINRIAIKSLIFTFVCGSFSLWGLSNLSFYKNFLSSIVMVKLVQARDLASADFLTKKSDPVGFSVLINKF